MERPLSFRGREPTQLSFGTSGLRGLVSVITDLETYVNARGFLDYLYERGEITAGDSVALAGDLRPSTDSPERSILRAVAGAVADAGLRVVNCGKIPTPALVHYAIGRGWPSIMVTGSHIPFDRNGIKFARSRGEVLKEDEAPILAAVEAARRREYARAREDSPFADDGMFRVGVAPVVPAATNDARDAYLRRYLEFFPGAALSGLRVLVYEHSAVGRELVVELLRTLGADVHSVGRTEHFVPIDTEAISDEKLRELQAMADGARSRVGPVDAIVSTDGDSDRPMLVGIDADGSARFFGGDLVGLVTAEYLGVDSVVVPVSATDAIDEYLRARNIQPVRTRIGSPFVIAAMGRQTGHRVVGWEANGGFLTASEIELGGRRIAPLPTRDAVLPILAVLHAAAREGVTLAELFGRLPRRFGRANLLDHVQVETSSAIVRRFSPGDALLRACAYRADDVYSTDIHGVERAADGSLRARLLEIRDELATFFRAERGFARVCDIDYLDGVRIRFENDDIVHIRPSGNAPQLRVYAVASSLERASEIVSIAVRDPGGILREMEARELGNGSRPGPVEGS